MAARDKSTFQAGFGYALDLAGPVAYAIEADTLTIHAGNAGLTFRAAP